MFVKYTRGGVDRRWLVYSRVMRDRGRSRTASRQIYTVGNQVPLGRLDSIVYVARRTEGCI
jgi:hypothetical protein